MKLIDLLDVLDKNCTVYIWAYSAEDSDSVILVSMRGEGNSIDPKFNDCEIDWISPTADGGIDINIDYEAFIQEALEVDEQRLYNGALAVIVDIRSSAEELTPSFGTTKFILDALGMRVRDIIQRRNHI